MKKFNQLYSGQVTEATREFKNRIIMACDKVGFPTDWNMGLFMSDEEMFIALDPRGEAMTTANGAPDKGLISMTEFEERFTNCFAGSTEADELRLKRSTLHKVFPATTVTINDQAHQDELMQACYDHGLRLSVGPEFNPEFPLLLVDDKLDVCTTKVELFHVSSEEFYNRLSGKGEFTPENNVQGMRLLKIKLQRGSSGGPKDLMAFLANLG